MHLLDVFAVMGFFTRDGMECGFYYRLASNTAPTGSVRSAVMWGGVLAATIVFGIVIFAHTLTDSINHHTGGFVWLFVAAIASYIFYQFVAHSNGAHKKIDNKGATAKAAFIGIVLYVFGEGIEFGISTLKSDHTAVIIGMVIGVAVVIVFLRWLTTFLHDKLGVTRAMFWENVALGYLGVVVIGKSWAEFSGSKRILWIILLVVDFVATTGVAVRFYRKKKPTWEVHAH